MQTPLIQEISQDVAMRGLLAAVRETSTAADQQYAGLEPLSKTYNIQKAKHRKTVLSHFIGTLV